MKKLLAVLLLILCSVQSQGQASVASVNLDFKTASAMEATYDIENAAEQRAVDNLNEILSHYTSAGIATAGIYLSKYKDRRSLTNVGLFSDEEEWYYQRIRNMVMNNINPMLLDVAIKLIKQPQSCLEWGPYLYRVTTNVENLCKQFELVATNGKLSFKDVPFLVINTALRKYFDLSQFDGVDWRKAINDVITVTKNINIKKILEEFKNVGAAIASAGKEIGESNYAEFSEVGKVFKTKPEEVLRLYNKYREVYEQIHSAQNAKDILLAVIGTTEPKGVYKLFMYDNYSIEGFISDYLKSLSEQYYRQRWYIYSEDKGDQILCDYTPTSYDDREDSRWSSEWLEFVSKRDKLQHHYLTTAERNQLKQLAKNRCGWDEARVAEYNRSHPNHHCEITYTLNHKDYTESYKHGLGGRHRKLHCFYSYSVVVEDKWNVEKDVYEEMYDSKTMDLQTFADKMKNKLDYYNSTSEDGEAEQNYKLGKDEPAYYQEADDKQVKGAANVTFLANCHDGATLADGSFSWYENGSQGAHLTDKSKDFALGNTILPTNEEGGGKLSDILTEQEAQQKQLEGRLAEIDKKLSDLIDQQKAAELAGDTKKRAAIIAERNKYTDQRNDIEQQLNDVKEEVNATNEAIDEFWEDQSHEDKSKYRITKNLKELGAAYQITWYMPGEWSDYDSDEYEYTVKGYSPTLKTDVVYTAKLRVARPPKYFMGIRVHRAILSVDYEISTHESSETVVDVMRFDKNEDAQSRADAVNNSSFASE